MTDETMVDCTIGDWGSNNVTMSYRSLASIILFMGLGVASDAGVDVCGNNSSNLVGVTVTADGECSSAFI